VLESAIDPLSIRALRVQKYSKQSVNRWARKRSVPRQAQKTRIIKSRSNFEETRLLGGWQMN
jgi:hypothetical protein